MLRSVWAAGLVCWVAALCGADEAHSGRTNDAAEIVSLLQTGLLTLKDGPVEDKITWNALESSEDAKNRDQVIGKTRKRNDAGIISRQGITRFNSPKGFYRPSDADRKKRETAGEGVDWSIEGMPDPDPWKAGHKGDIEHHYFDISGLNSKEIFNREEGTAALKPGQQQLLKFTYKDTEDVLKDHLEPGEEVLHPSVGPNTGKASDFTQGGADYEEDLPEPMAPLPPYLNSEPGEVPTAYRSFYPKNSQVAYQSEQKLNEKSVPVKNLPYVRSLVPSKLQDDYMVPAQFLPYYHPDSSGNLAQPGNAAPTSMQPVVASPQYDFPMPFQHGPMFPAFNPPNPGDPTINPPPTVPLPAPADFNGNARRQPVMPMPPLPPAMWPYS